MVFIVEAVAAPCPLHNMTIDNRQLCDGANCH
jgi:hypothetical protein